MSKVFDPNCPYCHGKGSFLFDDLVAAQECSCWMKMHRERAIERGKQIAADMKLVAADEWRDAAVKAITALERGYEALGDFAKPPFDGSIEAGVWAISMRCAAAEKRVAELEKEASKHEDQCMTFMNQRTDAEHERDQWKANHDNQLEIKRAVLDRPDLGERATLVQKLITERNALRERCEKAEAALRQSQDKKQMDDLRDENKRLTGRLNDFMSNDQNTMAKLQISAMAKQIQDLADEVKVLNLAKSDPLYMLRIARRIWRDLKHCIDDLPADAFFKKEAQVRLEYFGQFLGNHTDYRLHLSEQEELEWQARTAELPPTA